MKLRHALIGVTLLGCIAWGGSVMAEAPAAPEAPSTAASGADSVEQTRLWRAILPAGLSALALTLLAVYWVRRRREEPEAEESRVDPSQIASLEAQAQPVYFEGSTRPKPAYGSGEYGVVEGAVSVSSETHDRDASIAFLALDSETVDYDEDQGAAALRHDALDTSIACMNCDRCQRSFELGTTFCTHDGSLLIREDIPEVDEDRGEEGDESFEPTTPLLFCTGCGREFPLGTEACVECEGPLLFMIGRRTRGHSLQGEGPRTQICPDCGTQYSEGASFCGKDSSPLRPIN